MHFILLFVISFLYIVLLSSIFVYFLDKKIGVFVPLSFMLIALTYYCVGLLFGSFEYVKYILIIYAIVGTIFFAKCILNKKAQNIITNGLLFLLIIYVFVFIYCYRYNISYFDEFSAWSPMVRSMFINNRLYTVCFGGGTHIEYPPFLSILELFFCKVYGFFSESVSSIGLHIVSFSFFIVPYIDSFKLKFIKSLQFFIFVVLSTILFGYNFRSIMVDVPLAFIASFPMILVASNLVNSKFGRMYYGLSLGCLLLTKQSGVGFYIFNLFLYFMLNIKYNDKKYIYKNLLLIIFISLSIYLSWMIYIYYLGVGTKGQFSILSMISKLLALQIDETRINTLARIVKSIFIGNMLEGKIYLPWIAFFILILVLYFIFNRIYKINNTKIIYYILACTVIYFVFISFVYCFGMEEHEIESLNSFFRYVSTYNIFLIFQFLLLNREYIGSALIYVSLIVLLLINIPNYHIIIPRILIKGDFNNESSQETIECGNYISSYIEDDASILIVSDYNFTKFRLDYITIYHKNFYLSDVFNENCLDPKVFTNKKLIEEIKKYDYVVFYFKDSDILYQMNDYFHAYNSNHDIYNYIVYKVDASNDNKLLNMMT